MEDTVLYSTRIGFVPSMQDAAAMALAHEYFLMNLVDLHNKHGGCCFLKKEYF